MPCNMMEGITSGDIAMSETNSLRKDLKEAQSVIRTLIVVLNQHAQDLCDLREYILQTTVPEQREYKKFSDALDRLNSRQLAHREHDKKEGEDAGTSSPP